MYSTAAVVLQVCPANKYKFICFLSELKIPFIMIKLHTGQNTNVQCIHGTCNFRIHLSAPLKVVVQYTRQFPLDHKKVCYIQPYTLIPQYLFHEVVDALLIIPQTGEFIFMVTYNNFVVHQSQ